MPNLNKTIVGNIKVPVPSDETLNSFAAIKQKCISVRPLNSNFSHEKNFEALSQKAFAGEL